MAIIGKHLAIDLGDKRTGLAMCDDEGLIVSPIKVLTIESRDELAREIADFAKEERVDVLVLGLALHMNGSESQRSDMARDFGRKLAGMISIPIEFQDERLTSFAAETASAGTRTRSQKKARLDAEAAALILEDYLGQRYGRNVNRDEGAEVPFLALQKEHFAGSRRRGKRR